jgi:hypothetical protein
MNIWIYAAFEIITSTNSHTKPLKLGDGNKVRMVRDSMYNKKMAPTLKIQNLVPLP